jgi:hypothetical protein
MEQLVKTSDLFTAITCREEQGTYMLQEMCMDIKKENPEWIINPKVHSN